MCLDIVSRVCARIEAVTVSIPAKDGFCYQLAAERGKRDWIERERERGRIRYVDAPGDKGNISFGDGKSFHFSILRRQLV